MPTSLIGHRKAQHRDALCVTCAAGLAFCLPWKRYFKKGFCIKVNKTFSKPFVNVAASPAKPLPATVCGSRGTVKSDAIRPKSDGFRAQVDVYRASVDVFRPLSPTVTSADRVIHSRRGREVTPLFLVTFRER